MLEPATLPTQYYMAMLYTVTTSILFGQTIYYNYIYHQLKPRTTHRKDPMPNKREVDVKSKGSSNDGDEKQVHNSETTVRVDISSPPIQLPAFHPILSPGSELYYMSARSLSMSSTPTRGSVLVQRMASTSPHTRNSLEEPLLDPLVSSTQSEFQPQVKPLLSVVSAMSFLGTTNLYLTAFNEIPSPGFVIGEHRNQLQVKGRMLGENGLGEATGMGSFLGWGMAAIYICGRLPQILLNLQKGNAEGLNPLMFVFALVGNATYVASILVNNMGWSRIKPNLPWLVDAAVCVLLDTFILCQFIYFNYRKRKAKNMNKLSYAIV
ncbi:uncharacterized protein LOC133823210 isoform X2 [Humulus lupulus]|nr:uncharacterized protein LOC133823210 isoform X2 [Humulus lupulus]XP_062111837.1 uncharacterized protein LOC133823210 isoform X2 [Humulus lupulus]